MNCNVCWTPLSEESKTPFSATCQHKFCSDCLRQYLTTSFKAEEGGYSDLPTNNTCPLRGCLSILPDHEIRAFLTPAEYARHTQLMLTRTLSEMTDVRWCPEPGCPGVGFGKVDCNVVTCGTCFAPSCFHCRAEPHGVMSCSEYKEWKSQNYKPEIELISVMKALNLKECSRCGTRSELESGCNHVQCANCGFSYCWTCTKAWNSAGCGGYSCDGSGKQNLDVWVPAADPVPVPQPVVAPVRPREPRKPRAPRREVYDVPAWERRRRDPRPQLAAFFPELPQPKRQEKPVPTPKPQPEPEPQEEGWQEVRKKGKKPVPAPLKAHQPRNRQPPARAVRGF